MNVQFDVLEVQLHAGVRPDAADTGQGVGCNTLATGAWSEVITAEKNPPPERVDALFE